MRRFVSHTRRKTQSHELNELNSSMRMKSGSLGFVPGEAHIIPACRGLAKAWPPAKFTGWKRGDRRRNLVSNQSVKGAAQVSGDVCSGRGSRWNEAQPYVCQMTRKPHFLAKTLCMQCTYMYIQVRACGSGEQFEHMDVRCLQRAETLSSKLNSRFVYTRQDTLGRGALSPCRGSRTVICPH